MKTSNSLATLVMLVIAAMLTMYLGYYAWDTFQNPFSTTLAYQFTVNDSAPADGYIVRDELVLPGHSGILELSREEGEQWRPAPPAGGLEGKKPSDFLALVQRLREKK